MSCEDRGLLSAELRREIHAFIRESFLQLRPTIQLGETDDLVDAGVLDSLAFVELVEMLQTRYNVVIQDVDITREHFGSIAALERYVSTRRPS
jgi:acyl carrier protein